MLFEICIISADYPLLDEKPSLAVRPLVDNQTTNVGFELQCQFNRINKTGKYMFTCINKTSKC